MKNKILIGCLAAMFIVAGVMPMMGVDAAAVPSFAPPSVGSAPSIGAGAPSLGMLGALNIAGLLTGTGGIGVAKMGDNIGGVTNTITAVPSGTGKYTVILSQTGGISNVTDASMVRMAQIPNVPSGTDVKVISTAISTILSSNGKFASLTNIQGINDLSVTSFALPTSVTKTYAVTPAVSDLPTIPIDPATAISVLDMNNILKPSLPAGVGAVLSSATTASAINSLISGFSLTGTDINTVLSGLKTSQSKIGAVDISGLSSSLVANGITVEKLAPGSAAPGVVMNPTTKKLQFIDPANITAPLAIQSLTQLQAIDNDKIVALRDVSSVSPTALHVFALDGSALKNVGSLTFDSQFTDLSTSISEMAVSDKALKDYRINSYMVPAASLDDAKFTEMMAGLAAKNADKSAINAISPDAFTWNTEVEKLCKKSALDKSALNMPAYQPGSAFHFPSSNLAFNDACLKRINSPSAIDSPNVGKLQQIHFAALPTISNPSLPSYSNLLAGINFGGLPDFNAPVIPVSDSLAGATSILTGIDTSAVKGLFAVVAPVSSLNDILKLTTTLKVQTIDTNLKTPVTGADVVCRSKSSLSFANFMNPLSAAGNLNTADASSQNSGVTTSSEYKSKSNSVGLSSFNLDPYSAVQLIATKTGFKASEDSSSTGAPASSSGKQMQMESNNANVKTVGVYGPWAAFGLAALLLGGMAAIIIVKKKKGK
ncbi:MAG: hypothetical protein PHH26_01945 [Candidatus Thermoplasmatota archaeon]|nr:hypothetical protein [Candidatus Thermoplasmatota archaeon]